MRKVRGAISQQCESAEALQLKVVMVADFILCILPELKKLKMQ